MTLLVFLLTFAVIALAIIFVFCDWEKTFSAFDFSKRNLLFYTTVFIVAGLACVFYKIVLPLMLMFYVLTCSICLHILKKEFLPQDAPLILRINKSSYTIDNLNYTKDLGKLNFVKIDVCHLPDKLLVPFPRLWYKVNTSGAEVKKPHSKNVFINRIYQYLYSDYKTTTYEMPSPLVYPDVYSINCDKKAGNLQVRFVKAF